MLFAGRWPDWWKSEIHPTLAGSAAFAASTGLVSAIAVATTGTVTAASGTFQRAYAVLLDLAVSIDRVVDSPIEPEPRNFLGVLVSGGLPPEAPFGRRIRNNPGDRSHWPAPSAFCHAHHAIETSGS